MWKTLCPRAAAGYDTPTNPCVWTPSWFPVLKRIQNTLVFLIYIWELKCWYFMYKYVPITVITYITVRKYYKYLIFVMLQTLLVTGGSGSSPANFLSSTEIYAQSAWSYIASLPSPRNGLSAATVGNSVFVFGNIFILNSIL